MEEGGRRRSREKRFVMKDLACFLGGPSFSLGGQAGCVWWFLALIQDWGASCCDFSFTPGLSRWADSVTWWVWAVHGGFAVVVIVSTQCWGVNSCLTHARQGLHHWLALSHGEALLVDLTISLGLRRREWGIYWCWWTFRKGSMAARA